MNLQEDEGWWEGNLSGKTGMFPSNFVEILEGEEADKQSKRLMHLFAVCLEYNVIFCLQIIS